jgi:hypothetical protein
MATKKRAQLVAGLLEGRRAAPSATLHVLPIEPEGLAECEGLAEAVPVDAPPSEPPPRRAAVKGAKRRGDLSVVPIAAGQAVPIAAETAFHQKGSATAATFRPWYWQY